jgi:hypothetical protein
LPIETSINGIEELKPPCNKPWQICLPLLEISPIDECCFCIQECLAPCITESIQCLSGSQYGDKKEHLTRELGMKIVGET